MLINATIPKMTKLVLLFFLISSILWANDIKIDKKNYPSYLEFGITNSICTAQPNIGYWWKRMGFRFSGMYLNKDCHEYNINIGYRLYDSKKVQHSINLLTSWVVGSDPGADYKFGATGIAYSLNYRGFFLELGFARPWRDDIGNLANNPVIPCGYWGYIYRFR